MARNFSQILKAETVPAAVPQPGVYLYGPPGARRARTFSQVISEATRGVDAGMNRFTTQRPGLSSDAYAPDWRGHYLGKRDFAAVLKDVRSAITAKPAPAIWKATESGADGSLYVHRPLVNAADLHTWAKGAGIPNLVPPEEMHVTQVYSRQPVQLAAKGDTLTAAGGVRSLAPLGDKGAIVLHFDSPDLQARHAEAMKAGASHDWPKFLTHVTLSYDAGGVDLGAIIPPDFPLVFGPEVHQPINDNWAEEKGLRKFEICVPITKTDDDQNLVFGWAQVIEVDGVPVIDHQGDMVTEKDLEDAFYYFAQEGRETDEMHTEAVKGHMVECMVFTKEKQRALGINLGKVGAWVGFKVDDDTFSKVKSGDLPMFSIGGVGRRVPLDN